MERYPPFHVNKNEKRARVAILASDKTDSKRKKNMRQLGNGNDWVSEDTDFTRYGYGTYSGSFKRILIF